MYQLGLTFKRIISKLMSTRLELIIGAILILV